MEKRRTIILHTIMIVLTVALMLFCVFVCRLSFIRLWEAAGDLLLSFKYFGFSLFSDTLPEVTVISPSSSVSIAIIIPVSLEDFKIKMAAYGKLLLSLEGITMYFKTIFNGLRFLPVAIIILIPFIAIFFVIKSLSDKSSNNKTGHETLPLRIWKAVSKVVYIPLRAAFKTLISFIKSNRWYIKLWITILLISFNIVTIVLEFVSFYFYLCTSFDFINIYIQIYKLIVDITLAFSYLPLPFWILCGIILFDTMRKSIAKQRLLGMENANRIFIESLEIVNLLFGESGTGKTTLLTDMAESQADIFRNKAYDKLLDIDLLFPYFPWAKLVSKIKKAIVNHEIFTLASGKVYADKLKSIFMGCPRKKNIFGYDFNRYGLYTDTKLQRKFIFDVIKDYIQLYFVYSLDSSLIVSNFPIRDDGIVNDGGNMPLWDNDLLFRDTAWAENFSKFSHILDFDMLRLGKTVVEDNPNRNAFEFGVVCITEIGKERGNKNDNEGKKKFDEFANQLNDLFNTGQKMQRHSATIDNYPFVKVFTDDQRIMTVNADLRELTNLICIKEKSERKLAMPFFHFGELLYSFFRPRFENFYNDYSYRRGDTSLLAYLYKSIFAKIHSYFNGIYNRFGYMKLKLETGSVLINKEPREHNYFLIIKKIYSNRFATDCFADYFVEKTLRSDVGINDLRCYKNVKATFEELRYQNSYFIGDIEKAFNSDKNEDKDIKD